MPVPKYRIRYKPTGKIEEKFAVDARECLQQDDYELANDHQPVPAPEDPSEDALAAAIKKQEAEAEAETVKEPVKRQTLPGSADTYTVKDLKGITIAGLRSIGEGAKNGIDGMMQMGRAELTKAIAEANISKPEKPVKSK